MHADETFFKRLFCFPVVVRCASVIIFCGMFQPSVTQPSIPEYITTSQQKLWPGRCTKRPEKAQPQFAAARRRFSADVRSTIQLNSGSTNQCRSRITKRRRAFYEATARRRLCQGSEERGDRLFHRRGRRAQRCRNPRNDRRRILARILPSIRC